MPVELATKYTEAFGSVSFDVLLDAWSWLEDSNFGARKESRRANWEKLETRFKR